jgi:hypothetical protein
MAASARAGRRLYLDTSAYLCILLGEDGADDLSKNTDGAVLLSSVLLVLEARRTLVRLARMGTLDSDQYHRCIARLEQDTDAFALRDLTLDICTSGLMPPVATPRSLDLAHILTALWFQASEPIDRFVTVDLAQAQAAREMGLPV